MYELIEHRRLDTNTSTIEFSNIPQNYSDLVILLSLRSTRPLVDDGVVMTFNSQTTNRSSRDLYGLGSGSPASGTGTVMRLASCPAANSTASTFGNTLVHIPNYSGNAAKSSSVDGVMENNATYSVQTIVANLWNQTTAVSSIQISAEIAQFTQNSSATLYGVNRTAGIGRAPLAMGGYMSYSNGYWVHTFPSSGSFIPFTNMDVEYLVVAGGGGGGHNAGGGGGAGGYRTGSILNLVSGTNYTVTVGSGGIGAASDTTGGNGTASTFSSISSTGGGGGGSFNSNGTGSGNSGGSGGGARSNRNATGGAGNAGSYSPVEGTAGGGTGGASTFNVGGGGGGASEAGELGGGSSLGGKGGDGFPSSITGTLINYAGGGGGGANGTYETKAANAFGGGRGGWGVSSFGFGGNGTANRGGGGGGGGDDLGNVNNSRGGNGGSGIVIVRYRA